MNVRFASYALLLGNFIIGVTVLSPAGMLELLATALDVSIRDAGLLIAFGAVVLCIGSPVMAWATSTMDRRRLLSVTMALLAIGHAVSAFAPDYAALLVTRLALLAAAAVFTPLAATTIAMMVPEAERPSRISFVFVGWSLAIAVGLPIIAVIAAYLGWRMTYGVLAIAAAVVGILTAAALPSGLRGERLSMSSWAEIARNRRIIQFLLVTLLWVSGLYVIMPYFGPLLSRLTGAGPETAAAFFACLGVVGVLGNLLAARMVKRTGPYATSMLSMGVMFIGMAVWAAGAGSLGAMGLGVAFIGIGLSATNSMMQARLVAVAPAYGSASVALNTSWLYIGQSLGAWIGGELIARNLPLGSGYVAAAFILAALALLATTRER